MLVLIDVMGTGFVTFIGGITWYFYDMQMKQI